MSYAKMHLNHLYYTLDNVFNSIHIQLKLDTTLGNWIFYYIFSR